MPEEAINKMFFGLNEIMDKARKAYTKLFKKCLTWKNKKNDTSKKSKKS